jgi:putative ABC transport system permease protein
MILVLTGLFIGLSTSIALTRVMSRLLFGVTAFDVITFIGVSTLLVSAALLACYLPARRASKVDPLEALRCE